MTRGEAIRLNSFGVYPRLADKELIDRIYNDFNTCDSCKWYIEQVDAGTILCSKHEYLPEEISLCSLWEKQDDV